MPLTWKFVFAILFIGMAAWLTTLLRSMVREDQKALANSSDVGSGGMHRRVVYTPNKNIQPLRIVRNVVAGLALILFVFSCLTVVPTKEIGIKTSFGRPVGSLPNGLHPKFPWEKVTKIDGAIQTDSYTAEGKDGADGKCTDIRIGNESTACVDNSIRWRILPGQGDELFRDYRGFDNIRDSLVTREKNAALNDVLGAYNPLDAISENNLSGGADLDALGAQVTERLRQRIGQQIEVLNVIIPLIRFDQGTQDRLNAYQAEVANTRIAQQRELTAKADARANEALSASVSNDPNVLVSKCLDLVKEGKSLPAGFSCWPGGQSAIVVPAA